MEGRVVSVRTFSTLGFDLNQYRFDELDILIFLDFPQTFFWVCNQIIQERHDSIPISVCQSDRYRQRMKRGNLWSAHRKAVTRPTVCPDTHQPFFLRQAIERIIGQFVTQARFSQSLWGRSSTYPLRLSESLPLTLPRLRFLPFPILRHVSL